MPEPRVDVVIVSWNVRDDLLRCVASVRASRGVDVSVIVVDNDSADGSADAVAQRFPEVSVVRNPENEGFARAVNRGTALGTSPYILLLNPDCEVRPPAVADLVAHLDDLPDHGAVAPRLVGADGEPQHSVHGLPSLGVSLLLATGVVHLLPRSLRARMLLEGSWASDVERDVPWALGAALLVRREVVDGAGGLDERFFVYAEDMEWCDRLRRAGHPVRFTPAVTVVHAGNRSGVQRYGDDRTAAHLRSTLRFLRARHGRLWTAAFVAVNGAATVGRYAAYRAAERLRPSPRASAGVSEWRPYARYYLGRVHPVDPART